MQSLILNHILSEGKTSLSDYMDIIQQSYDATQ